MIKNLLLILLSFFGITHSFSQSITIDELISLRKKSIGEVEEALTSKGWVYQSGIQPDEHQLGTVLFASKPNYHYLQPVIMYLYSSTDVVRISITGVKKDRYDILLARIKSLGYKLISSKMSRDTLIKIYQGPTLTFEISVDNIKDGTDPLNVNAYTITIFENNDYERNKADN